MCAQFAGQLDRMVSLARAGDEEAFAEIVGIYGPDVLRLCAVITTDEFLAEDAAQNAWQKAWQRLGTLREPQNLRPWLLRVAANEAKQLVRRRRRELSYPLGSDAGAAGTGDPHRSATLALALRSIDPGDRELLAYRYVLGHTSHEIGQHLGMSPEGVRSRLMRLRHRLQREMGDNG